MKPQGRNILHINTGHEGFHALLHCSYIKQKRYRV